MLNFYKKREQQYFPGLTVRASKVHINLASKQREFRKVLLFLFFLVISMALIIPFSPKMPALGLDPSWALAINEAVAQRFSFGKDIIFTLGPYAAIYTKIYHPATDAMMLWGSCFISLIYGCSLLLLIRRTHWFWDIALTIFLMFFVYAKDSLLLSLPLLLGINVFYYVQHQTKSSIKVLLLLGIMFSVFGLLPLIKGSLLLFCGAILLLIILFLWVNHYYYEAAVVFIAPAGAICFFWLAAGQSIIYLGAYLSTSIEMAFSFTEAMSFAGNANELLVYVVASILLLICIFTINLKQYRWYLAGLFFLFLWLSFKAAFTRHLGHSLIAGTSLGFAALLLPFVVSNNRKSIWAIVFALLVSFYIEMHYTAIHPLRNIQSTYTAAGYGLLQRIKDPLNLKRNYQLSMQFLEAHNRLPRMAGRSDIYSYDQSDLIASKNHWSPRPVFQSYSVFNAHLAKINQRHLFGTQRPDTVFFKIQAIDNRLPALEEGLSWFTLLTNYQPGFWHNGFLVLKKGPLTTWKEKSYFERTVFLNEELLLPSNSEIVFIKITLKPSFWGKISQLFYKPQELLITLNTHKEKKTFRFIAAMARSGFVVSPLIENTQEFDKLYYNPALLQDKKTVSLLINTVNKKYLFNDWQPQYHVRFITFK